MENNLQVLNIINQAQKLNKPILKSLLKSSIQKSTLRNVIYNFKRIKYPRKIL